MKIRSLAGLVASALIHAASAQGNTSPAGDTAAAGGKARAVPFHGVIASVDEKARTFTIAGKGSPRSFKVTETTVITKADEPATMKDIVTNKEARGSYYKRADGTLEAKTVKLGPLTDAEKAEKDARKQKREKRSVSPSAPPE